MNINLLFFCDLATEKQLLTALREFAKNETNHSFNFIAERNLDDMLNLIKSCDCLSTIIFASTNVNDANLIQLAKQHEDTLKSYRVIFVGNEVDDRFNVYEVKHTFYLDKNSIEKYITKAMDLTIKKLKHKDTDELVIRNKSYLTKITFNKIKYLESSGRQVIVHCLNEDYTIYSKLTDLEINLPNTFLRCHKSYIVNVKYLAKIHANKLTIYNNINVPISRSNHKQVTSFLEKNISKSETGNLSVHKLITIT